MFYLRFSRLHTEKCPTGLWEFRIVTKRRLHHDDTKSETLRNNANLNNIITAWC